MSSGRDLGSDKGIEGEEVLGRFRRDEEGNVIKAIIAMGFGGGNSLDPRMIPTDRV